VRKGLLTFAVTACLTLSGCSIIPNHDPQPKDYAVSFSMDNKSPFLTSTKPQHQVQFSVNVSKWSQNYDQKNSEVFLIVTDKDHVPVMDLETDNANNFSYGGWFNLKAENPIFNSLGLQPIETDTVPNNWFNLMNASQAAAKFIARTNKPVNPTDWRFVIMAIRGEQGGTKVLWTKVVSPS
jgi:hypothetical protein